MTTVITADMEREYQRAEARRLMAHRIRRVTWTASVALFGAGVGVSLSIIFLAAGAVLMAAAVALALVGTLASVTIPRLVYY